MMNSCIANGDSYKLSASEESEFPSLNGGEKYFTLKGFEVYIVTVTILP